MAGNSKTLKARLERLEAKKEIRDRPPITIIRQIIGLSERGEWIIAQVFQQQGERLVEIKDAPEIGRAVPGTSKISAVAALSSKSA